MLLTYPFTCTSLLRPVPGAEPEGKAAMVPTMMEDEDKEADILRDEAPPLTPLAT
jgi:hypothetical protein